LVLFLTGQSQAGVTLNKIVGGGRALPGLSVALPSFVGRVSQEFDGVEAIWAFLMRHRRTN